MWTPPLPPPCKREPPYLPAPSLGLERVTLGHLSTDLSLRTARHDPVCGFCLDRGLAADLDGGVELGRGGGKRGQLARRHAWPTPPLPTPPPPLPFPSLPSRLLGTVFGGPLWMRDTPAPAPPLPWLAPHPVGAGGGGSEPVDPVGPLSASQGTPQCEVLFGEWVGGPSGGGQALMVV